MIIQVASEEPMIWHACEALGEEVRGGCIDVIQVVSPLPSRQHQSASRHLAGLLEVHAPDGAAITEGWGWKPGSDEHDHDVMVHPRTEEQVRFTGPGEVQGRPGMVVDVATLLAP